MITSFRDRTRDKAGGACAFRPAEIVEYRHTGATGKDKMPETDEICDVRPAKSLLPL